MVSMFNVFLPFSFIPCHFHSNFPLKDPLLLSFSMRFWMAVASLVTAPCLSMIAMKISSPRCSSSASTSALRACSRAMASSSRSTGTLAMASLRAWKATEVGDVGWSLRSTEKFRKDTVGRISSGSIDKPRGALRTVFGGRLRCVSQCKAASVGSKPDKKPCL